MTRSAADELTDALVKLAEYEDVGRHLAPWQRQVLEHVYRYQRSEALVRRQAKKNETMRYVTAKNYSGLPPTLTFLDEAPEYILVRPGQPVKEPFNYYKSAPWVANHEQLMKTIKTWSDA